MRIQTLFDAETRPKVDRGRPWTRGWAGLRTGGRIAVLAFLLVLGFESLFFETLFADETTVSREQLQKLIKNLEAETLAERSRAERQILDLGPAILSKLPAMESVENRAARESLRRVRIQLERRAAKESSTASLVTLEGNLSLEEILTQIQSQTGNSVSIDEDQPEILQQMFELLWEKKPFWECVDDLCDRGGYRWRIPADAAVLRISKSDRELSSVGVIQRIGPFRLAIEPAQIRPVIGEPLQRLLRVRGRLSVEPRIRPLFLAIAAADLKGMTEHRLPLVPWNPDAKYEHPVGDGGHEVPVAWDFSLAEGTELKSLQIQGKFFCQIAAATERVVFDQTSLARGTIRRRGGVSVRLREALFSPTETNDLDAEIGVAVSYDTGGPAFESHRTWIFHNAVYLETKSGTRVRFTDFETTQQADGAVAVDYRWRKLPAPANQYRFVYEAPTLILDLPIEVELQEIPVRE